MKRLLIILSAILTTIPLYAQKVLENDEIIATVGVNVPMYRSMESDVVIGLHYGHYYPNGVGFRAGFQYIPTVVEIDNNFRYHIQKGAQGSDDIISSAVKPVKWFFTFNGGLAFRF